MRFGLGKAALVLLAVQQVLACECVYELACARIHRTASIFIGRVTDPGRDGSGPFRFEVEEAFKGVDQAAREVVVLPGLCVAGYRRGVRYLVLAGRLPDGSLYSGDCTGTVPVDDAGGDIRLIRAWASGTPVQELRGRVAENEEDSMVRFELEVEHRAGLAGVDLTAVMGDRSFTAKTDSRGMFRIQVPEAGTYQVKAGYPGHSSTKSEYEFSVQRGECSEHDIGMRTDSKVSRVVLDSARHPVPGMPVEMMPYSSETSFAPLSATTDANGLFTFSKVPKGEYLLGVNLSGLSSKLPYEPRYFPGVTRREMAVPVRIGGPVTLADLNFQIGGRVPTRQIKVSVVWPDGRPVTNASVLCESSRSDDRRFRRDWISRYTDSRGEAVCEVLADRDYQIEVDRLNWSASSRPVLPIAIRPRIFVATGNAQVSVQITVDRSNDISDKEAPADMSSFNERPH
jgi:hypothetical protein